MLVTPGRVAHLMSHLRLLFGLLSGHLQRSLDLTPALTYLPSFSLFPYRSAYRLGALGQRGPQPHGYTSRGPKRYIQMSCGCQTTCHQLLLVQERKYAADFHQFLELPIWPWPSPRQTHRNYASPRRANH